MKIINFFKNLLKKKPKKLSVDGENFQRMGFGKKIWFKKIPCRYIYSKGDFDFFVREDKKSVIYFQSTYVDKVETVNMMSREKPKKLFKVKKDSSN